MTDKDNIVIREDGCVLKSAIAIYNNQELIDDINQVLKKHGLNVIDTSVEIESDTTAIFDYNVFGHKMYINTLLLHTLKEYEGKI